MVHAYAPKNYQRAEKDCEWRSWGIAAFFTWPSDAITQEVDEKTHTVVLYALQHSPCTAGN